MIISDDEKVREPVRGKVGTVITHGAQLCKADPCDYAYHIWLDEPCIGVAGRMTNHFISTEEHAWAVGLLKLVIEEDPW